MKKLFQYLDQFLKKGAPPVVLLDTERLLIRMYQEEDLEDLYEFASMPATSQYDFHEPYKKVDAEQEIRQNMQKKPNLINDFNTYAIALKSSGKMIGTLTSTIEEKAHTKKQARIGYMIHPYHQQQGYAYEACHAFIGYLFKQDIHRISASCFTENTASWRLLEKLGLRREAHHLRLYFVKGRFWDEYEYALTKEEWTEKAGLEQ